jgi:GH35 family endo-1,4-beta-xylanase
MLENYDIVIPETNMIWSEVETSEDEYDFSFVDEYLDWCERNNVEPIGMPCNAPSEQIGCSTPNYFHTCTAVAKGQTDLSILFIAGHCLMWKGIGWMSSHPAGMSDEEIKELYLTRMEDYIKTMMTRYKSMLDTYPSRWGSRSSGDCA